MGDAGRDARTECDSDARTERDGDGRTRRDDGRDAGARAGAEGAGFPASATAAETASGAAPGAEAEAGAASESPEAAERRVGRVLDAHRPRVVPPGGADRRAAVVLVLRPGGGAGRPRVDVGAPAGSATGGGAAPLFPRPLPPDLAGLEALFILRAEREGDPWSGHVGLPGGHEEPADADLPDAALRELREETGLALGRRTLLGRLDDVHPRSRRLPSVAVSPYVAWHAADAPVKPGPEVAGHFWTPLAELEDPRRRTLLTFRREGAYRVFPGVEREGEVIWGLTFVIVRRFLALLPRGPGGEPSAGRRPGAAVSPRR